MLEASRIAKRRAALSSPSETGAVVRPLPAESRFSLRLPGILPRATGEDPGLATIAGLPLDLPINRFAVCGSRLAVRLGPDEWLLLGPEAETDVMAGEIERALAGRVHSLVDISHRQVGIAVRGPHAAAIVNAGCPLDLHPSRFPPGSGTRTVLGKAEIILMREDTERFRIECWRSYADYVQTFLLDAALDYEGA